MEFMVMLPAVWWQGR